MFPFKTLPPGVHITPHHRLHIRPIPLFASRVPAGFPSPAEDHLETALDLNDLVVKHPAATFFVRVEGHSMVDAGIQDGDVLVVDRALEPGQDTVVVAALNGEFTVKRIGKIDGQLYLLPASSTHAPMLITEEVDFLVWGVVTYVIHRL